MKKYFVLNWRKEIFELITASGNDAVYVIDKKYLYTDFDRCLKECLDFGVDHIVVEDLGNINSVYSLISYLKENEGRFSDVFSFDESTQFAAALINREVFGNTHMADLLLATRDKRQMRNTLAGTVSMPAHFSVLDSIIDGRIDFLPENFYFPLILKPVNRFLSAETYLVRTYDELNEALNKNKYNLSDFICEEYIDGSECNVDIIWERGELKAIYIATYYVPRLTGYNNRIPKMTTYIPYQGNECFYEKLKSVNEKIAQRLNIENGVTHGEFFIRNEEVYLGEIAFRHPGGAANQCIKLAIGEGLLEQGLRARLNYHNGEPCLARLDDYYIGNIDVRPSRSGVVTGFTPADELLSLPGVIDVIYRVRLNHYIEDYGRESWCVIAILKGKDRDTLIAQMKNVQENFSCTFSEPV
ncbi:Uncharacterised protein [Serratia ficaria]|uniref:ATP-grasp domain-containing protein n=1 Tax=Serratia ficaria TaxID=61651 RepID=UPI00218327F0|nr:ATP-grasp domain-containing protein [Serratia ficaria]CAI2533178.1 Uncharacterised protein [Serratia ficaria]